MELLDFVGIDLPQRTASPIADTGALLLSRGKAATWQHVQSVADCCASLAARFDLDEGAGPPCGHPARHFRRHSGR